MNKKIALCFSGQIRSHHKITEHWIHHVIIPLLTANYEVTVFFYLGEDSNFNQTWDIVKERYQQHNINIIHKTEKDKNFENIVPNAFLLTCSGLKNGHNQLIREHYYMDKVIELKRQFERKQKFKFDYVIRTRPDCIPKYFNPDLLYDVNQNFCISDHDHHSYINGRFTICNSKIADKIFTILKNYNNTIDRLEYSNRADLDSHTKYFAGEFFWKTHLSLFDINIKLIPYTVYLVRDYDELVNIQERGRIYLDGRSVASFDSQLSTIPLDIIK
jgi:hypothetical protein